MLTFIDQSLVLLAWEQVLINIGASHLHPREKVVKLTNFCHYQHLTSEQIFERTADKIFSLVTTGFIT